MAADSGLWETCRTNYAVAVNGNHTIVQKILKAESEEQQLKLAKQAYDLALLITEHAEWR